LKLVADGGRNPCRFVEPLKKLETARCGQAEQRADIGDNCPCHWAISNSSFNSSGA